MPTNRLADQPTVRLCRFALLELEDMLEFGRRSVASLVDAQSRRNAQDWQWRLDAWLAAPGGLDGAAGGAAERPVWRPGDEPDVAMSVAVNAEALMEARGINPKIARRRTEHGSGLGIYRWVVERTESWLLSFRKLRIRTDRSGKVHKALVALAKVLICMWFI